jgi:hypothetical protein
MSLSLLLTVAAAGEVLTGLALLMALPPVIRLLFGAEIAGAGIAMSRIAGISLLALGVSCWPVRKSACGGSRALVGMLSYSLLVAAYLIALGIEGQYVGRLLWPAVVAHATLSGLLVRGWLNAQSSRVSQTRQ